MNFTSDAPPEYLDLQKLTLRFVRRWKTIIMFVAFTVALVMLSSRPASIISNQSLSISPPGSPETEGFDPSEELFIFTREFIKSDGLQNALAAKLGIPVNSFRIQATFQDISSTMVINCIAQDRSIAISAGNNVLPVLAEAIAPVIAPYKNRYTDAAQFFPKSKKQLAHIEQTLAASKTALMDLAKKNDKKIPTELWLDILDQVQTANLQIKAMEGTFNASYKESLNNVMTPELRRVAKPHTLQPKTKLKQAIILFVSFVGGLMTAILWIVLSDWVSDIIRLHRAEKNAN
nr:hypothetical protein [uncultured Pseudodesulfovibrio sp.]